MTIYKISFVVEGGKHPGAIINKDHRPIPGEKIQFGDQFFKILEVQELLPPRGDFQYLHATCALILKSDNK